MMPSTPLPSRENGSSGRNMRGFTWQTDIPMVGRRTMNRNMSKCWHATYLGKICFLQGILGCTYLGNADRGALGIEVSVPDTRNTVAPPRYKATRVGRAQTEHRRRTCRKRYGYERKELLAYFVFFFCGSWAGQWVTKHRSGRTRSGRGEDVHVHAVPSR